jgi:hypothetical protein
MTPLAKYGLYKLATRFDMDMSRIGKFLARQQKQYSKPNIFGERSKSLKKSNIEFYNPGWLKYGNSR